MKLTLAILLLFIGLRCGAQSPSKKSELKNSATLKHKELYTESNITFPELREGLINDLELLGRIWGFMKYHHPEVGKGTYNWDFELFRILPSYLNNKSIADRNQTLSEWIDKYGKIKKCNKCRDTAPSAILKPDHTWIENNNLSADVKSKLQNIYQNRFQGKHYYIRLAPNVRNPQFLNENPYADMPYPDAGYRLLALYKYWNMIQYFFPNRHLMDKSWEVTLKEYIPIFINAKNELEYEFAAIRMIGDVQDTHANLWGGNNKINEWKGRLYPPIQVKFIQDKLVVTDYYNPELKKEVGLEIGDVITQINKKRVEDIVKDLKPYFPASNEAAQLRDIAADILRSNDTTLHLAYISETENLERDIKLYDRKELNYYRWYRNDDSESYKLLDNNIGYITLKNIKREDIAIIKEKFKNIKGIIIDQRNYPSLFVPFALGSYFNQASLTPFVSFTHGNPNNPGEFTMAKTLSIPQSKDAYHGKLVVIINEISQSQAEYTAMAFRAGSNTTIIGSTTAGADGNVSTIFLPGGLRTMISGIGVYYPDGKETQRIGIVPDIEVKPSIIGIKNGKDELLEKAVELINK